MLLAAISTSALDANCCCNPHIVDIYYVPFHIDGTINPSNTTYCVTQNLTYLGGEGLPTAAITVDPGVHDIVINFNGFELDLDPSVDGISMLGTAGQPITDVLIKDGVIKSLSPSGVNNGIKATNFSTVDVERMRFVDERRGFNAPTQTDTNTDLTMRSCVFDLKGNTGASRRGVALATIQGCLFEECTFLASDPAESSVGILFINNAKNAFIQRCTFDGQRNTAVAVQSLFDPESGFFFTFPSTNIQIDECEFTNNFQDFKNVGASNIQITNSSFYGTTSAAILDEAADDGAGNFVSPIPSGLLVDNCTVTEVGEGEILDGIYPSIFLFAGGVVNPGINARDIIIRNSTFTHQGSAPGSDGLLFVGVEGVLVEDCVVNLTASGREDNCQPVTIFGVPTKVAAIHCGWPLSRDNETAIGGSIVRDITIRGNEICGSVQVGIFAETGIGTTPNERITIEDNSITASEAGILFANTHSSTIINNRIQGVSTSVCKKGVGIELEGPLAFNPQAASNSNIIVNNVVSQNDTGILLECGAQANLVKGNYVFNNFKRQIKEEKKKTNVILCNTVFHHHEHDISCSSISE